MSSVFPGVFRNRQPHRSYRKKENCSHTQKQGRAVVIIHAKDVRIARDNNVIDTR